MLLSILSILSYCHTVRYCTALWKRTNTRKRVRVAWEFFFLSLLLVVYCSVVYVDPNLGGDGRKGNYLRFIITDTF